jgi:hypothetical protein
MRDIESDLSAIHGIWIDPDRNEWGGLSAPRFFRLVWRLPAYEGAMRAQILAETREEQGRHERIGLTPDDAPPIPLTPEMAKQAPLLAGLDGLIDWKTSGGDAAA